MRMSGRRRSTTAYESGYNERSPGRERSWRPPDNFSLRRQAYFVEGMDSLLIDVIIGLETPDSLSDGDAMDAIAILIDHSLDNTDLALTNKALAWSEILETRESLSPIMRTLLDYYRANAWANRQHAAQSDPLAMWAWDQEEIRQQIFYLRRALSRAAFSELHVIRQCQILTNLANQLDTVGRFAESQGIWREALNRLPAFWMARCNRGRGLMFYARALYDPGHAAMFALVAHDELLHGIQSLDQHPDYGQRELRPFFENFTEAIAQHYDLDHIGTHWHGEKDDGSLDGYRLWCVQNTLFLNPLNDLGSHSIAARDVLTLPSFITPVGEPPLLIGLFNQLKQEFVSARWLYYEGISANEVHLSDRDVLLYNTLDYPAYGLAVEQIKISFRMTYSILDKIAYFLNFYLKLGVPERRVSFRTIWREKNGDPVRKEFSAAENWPFRGLYWLGKDLFEDDFQTVAAPGARELSELRNHLEHKYVKVHTDELWNSAASTSRSMFLDTLAHSLTAGDLRGRTLHLIKLVRSALIYLSLGMHREEERRRAALGADAFIPPMQLDEWDDDWKI